jgi:hypothetical protein
MTTAEGGGKVDTLEERVRKCTVNSSSVGHNESSRHRIVCPSRVLRMSVGDVVSGGIRRQDSTDELGPRCGWSRGGTRARQPKVLIVGNGSTRFGRRIERAIRLVGSGPGLVGIRSEESRVGNETRLDTQRSQERSPNHLLGDKPGRRHDEKSAKEAKEKEKKGNTLYRGYREAFV